MKFVCMNRFFVMLAFLFGVLGLSLYYVDDDNGAFAICCFPYENLHYVDPVTGHLIVEGQIRNDSYKSEPFGKVNYEFRFYDSEQNVLLERDLQLTDGHPINGEFVIPPGVALPFHIVLDDIDAEIIQKIEYVGTGGTNNLDYFTWKPADLEIKLGEIKKIATLFGTGQELFYKWEIGGTITNTHSEKTDNVYVVASVLDDEHRFLGTAGYSGDKNSVQPLKLDAFETKDFVIYSVLPEERTPDNVFLYAESDDSSMVYPYYQPLKLKNVIDYDARYVTDPKTPILISANVTNTSRDNFDLDWIIQIKKSPASVLDGDGTKYHNSTVMHVDRIPMQIEGQQSILLEYPWIPTWGGVYFYEMFLWSADNVPSSYPFTGNFLSHGEFFVHPSLYSIKNQLNSGKSFDDLVCREGLELAHRASNANFVCIKSESVPRLLERGWLALG